MNRYIVAIGIGVAGVLATSCNDWLVEPSPGVTKYDDFFVSEEAVVQVVNACYVPLAWEFNQPTGFYSEWFVGDVVSDDALKGGQDIGDISYMHQLETFAINASNPFMLEFYRAQYQGIARCNLAIQEIAKVGSSVLPVALRDRLQGEVLFMRAYYYFRLVRMFGGVPKVDFVLNDATKWKQPRATKEEIYELIVSDLLKAEKQLWPKSNYPQADLGRATQGSAQAMLLKTYLYIHNYSEAEKWGKILADQDGGEYHLCPVYADNFSLLGENGVESVFEIQYTEEPTSDWGDGNGFARGAFSPILTRSRAEYEMGNDKGYGFNRPTRSLYNEFESNDPRRDFSILTPKKNLAELSPAHLYLGNYFHNGKYALLTDGPGHTIYPLAHQTRGPINTKLIRYADVLLMYAEACCETGNATQAKWALEEVRKRARQGDATALPQFPNYNGYQDNLDDLRKAVRHERRVELAMEGHRWFDLLRWGIAAEAMEAYKLTETEEVVGYMHPFIPGVHEVLPIPQEEIDLGGLKQNPGYN